MIALARKPGTPGRNNLEKSYALYLDSEKARGDILYWQHEGAKLKLADGAWYTPDFMVVTSSQELEFHETKGFWREAALVRIKVAAGLYPFRFVAIQKATKKDGGGWKLREF